MSDVGLFDLAEQRLGWLDARQRLTSQNIANADTPSFQPRDMAPFEKVLAKTSVQPVTTSPLHMVNLSVPLDSEETTPSGRAPDGNAVNIEDELARVGDDETQQGLVDNLWKSYMGMFMTALGHGG